MTPVSSMTLAASSPISAPMPRPLVKAPPGPFGPIPSDVMKISFGGKRERLKCICAPKEVDACANLDRHAESVDDEGRKHGSDVLVYDNVGNLIEFGRFAIDNHQTSAVSFGEQGESGGRPHHQ